MGRLNQPLPVWTLILTLFLIPNLAQACAKGCLRCGTDAKCSICDRTERYYRKDDGTCERITIENCLISGFDKNECSQCEKEMIYDPNTSKCVGVPSDKKTPNCLDYNQSGECVHCQLEYYLNSGECLPVTLDVPNCLVFSKADFCLICDSTRMFDENSGKCVDFTPVANCGIHSNAVCDECLHDYGLMPRSYNFPFEANLVSKPQQDFVSFVMNDVSFLGKYRQTAPSRCLKMAPGCQTIRFNATTKLPTGCEICLSNYLLNTETGICEDMPSPIIDNCHTYSNLTTCLKCHPQFWLNSNLCVAHTEVTNCMIYKGDADECYECDATHFLATASLCTLRTRESIDNCTALSRTLDECQSCETLFRMTDDKKGCLTQIENCKSDGYAAHTFVTAEYLCDTCNTSFYPATDKKTCIAQSSPFCTAYEVGNNSCTGCSNLNFFLDGASPNITCKVKTQANCTSFTSDFINKCSACSNLFSLDVANGTCVALTDLNCVRNTVNTVTCLACKPGFVLDGNDLCIATTRAYDDLCIESQTVEGKCTKCQLGYEPFEVSSFIKTLPARCQSVNSSNDQCKQCDEDMDGIPEVSGPPAVPAICVPKTGADGKCKQLSYGQFEPLGDNDNKCKKCRDYNLHYHNSNTCKNRTPYKNIQCKELLETGDYCLGCNEGFSFGKLGKIVNTCMPKPTDFVEIGNCATYDFYTNGDCLECTRNHHVVTGNPDTCEADLSPVTAEDLNLYFLEMGSYLTVAPDTKASVGISNCKKSIYVYNGVSGQVCVECKDGYTAIGESSIFAGELDDYQNSGNLWTFPKNYKITECRQLTSADYVRYAIGSSNTNLASSCNRVIEISALLGVKCVECKDNYVGTAKTLAFDKSDAPMTAVLGYENCALASDYGLQRINNNQGFRFIKDNNTTVLFMNQPLSFYDHCTDSTKKPVLFSNYNGGAFEMKSEGVATKEQPEYQCMVIPDNKKKASCAVFYLEADDTTDPRDYNTANFKCFKCLPGYRLKEDTIVDGIFGECEAIENCNLNPTSGKKNSWLDACNSCNEGYTWGWVHAANHKIPNIQRCVDIRRFPHCMVFDSNNKKCIMCNPDKTLSPHTGQCEDYPSVCAAKGMPNMDTEIVSTWGTSRDLSQSFLIHHFLNFIKTGPTICSACNSDSKFFRGKDTTEGNFEICKTNAFNNSNVVTGCKIHNGREVNKCFECYPEFVLNDDDKQCVRRILHDNYRYCDLLKNTVGNWCRVCNAGRVANDSGQCLENHFCEEYENTPGASQCQLCMHGYKLKVGQPWQCEPVELDDQCIQYGIENECKACKDPLQEPIRNMVHSMDERDVTCVTNPKLRKSIFDHYYFYYETGSTFGLTGKLNWDKIPVGSHSSTLWSTSTTGVKSICLRTYKDCGCATYDNIYKCATCKDEFYLDSDSKTCKKNNMIGCLNVTGASTCSLCDHINPEKYDGFTFYLNSNKCLKHTLVNCKEKSNSSNTCLSCMKGYHKDANDHCLPNTLATNCLLFTTNLDQCTKCAKAYYRDGTICRPHTVSNCKTYDENSNSCTECEVDYYRFNSSSVYKCAKNTAPNCKTKSTTVNACSDCNEGEFFPNGKDGCIAILPIPNCMTSNKVTGKCSVCNEGFWIGSDFLCYANPTGVKNCVLYSDKTTCTVCDTTHFLKENKCELLTALIVNCAIHSDNSVCQVCLGNNIISADSKTCSPVTELTCGTWKDAANCETCSGNTVLKTDSTSSITICVASGLSQCATAAIENNVNVCMLCNKGFILRDAKCDPPKVNISNCEEYDVENETCKTCFNGFLLSPLKDKCENRIGEAGTFCAKGHLVEQAKPVCVMCGFGSYEDSNNECVSCGGDGCQICDLADSSKCVLCKTTFFMNSGRTCEVNEPKVITSARIFSLLSAFALISLLFRD